MIDRLKYIVFKRADFEKLVRNGESGSTADYRMRPFEQLELEGPTVIRPEDIFAAPALYGYAASISVALNLLPPNHPDRKHLQELADYFHEQANEAAEKGYKVPD